MDRVEYEGKVYVTKEPVGIGPCGGCVFLNDERSPFRCKASDVPQIKCYDKGVSPFIWVEEEQEA